MRRALRCRWHRLYRIDHRFLNRFSGRAARVLSKTGARALRSLRMAGMCKCVLGHVARGHGRLARGAFAHVRAQRQVGKLALKTASKAARRPIVQGQIPLVRANEPLHLIWTRLPLQRALATMPPSRFLRFERRYLPASSAGFFEWFEGWCGSVNMLETELTPC